MRLNVLTKFAGVLLSLFLTTALSAQNFPNRTVTFVVPSPPGGVTDIDARVLAKVLSEKLGQAVIVDARPGAGGSLSADYVARAKPDGYTMLWATSGTIATNPWIYNKLSYDPFKSFKPVHSLQQGSPILLVPRSSPFKSTRDLVAFAKANPKKINFGSAGNGTGQHIAMELFKAAAGIEVTHVPYRGSAQSMNDLLAEVIDTTFDYISPARAHLEAGSLRALAVTSAERMPVLPDVQTLTEIGYPVEWVGWSSVVVPANTPDAVVDVLARAFAETLASPEVVRHATATGTSALPFMTKTALEDFHRRESEKVRKIVDVAKIRID